MTVSLLHDWMALVLIGSEGKSLENPLFLCLMLIKIL